MQAARLALFLALMAERKGGTEEPMLMPQMMKEAKWMGISPCRARACNTPTAAEEDWMTAQSSTPTSTPTMGFWAVVMNC